MSQSKTQTGKLNKNSKPIRTLYPDPSNKQGHIKTQKKGWRKTHQSNGKQKEKPKNKKQEL